MTTRQSINRLLGLGIVAVLLGLPGEPPVQAWTLPACDTACGSGASCATACEYPAGESWVFTVCGEYDGGPANGWCGDPVCEDICSLTEACVTECYAGGESLTTCGVFNDGRLQQFL